MLLVHAGLPLRSLLKILEIGVGLPPFLQNSLLRWTRTSKAGVLFTSLLYSTKRKKQIHRRYRTKTKNNHITVLQCQSSCYTHCIKFTFKKVTLIKHVDINMITWGWFGLWQFVSRIWMLFMDVISNLILTSN